MATVKVLLVSTSKAGWGKGKKGDLWAITPGDFGTEETHPWWVQLTLTDVPNQQSLNPYLVSMVSGFDYSEVAGADIGKQRYRVERKPEVSRIPIPIFAVIRDGVSSLEAFNAVYVGQSPGNYFEFDGYEGIPLDELEYAASKFAGESRRYGFDDNYIDNLSGDSAAGDPVTDTQSWTWFLSNIQDKLG